MKDLTKKLDEKACELLAKELRGISMFKGKSMEEIASKLPEYLGLSRQISTREGIVGRSFGMFSAMVYDLKTQEKAYLNDLAEAKKNHLDKGVNLFSKDFLYGILDKGIKQDIAYVVMGHR
ncbi:hypothetical protein KAJ38_02575 [Candidatus Pacearchaeota archaeon]|nr:hypothetical protein [Candidatus Pacearchaeota archaeon]